MGAAAPFIKVAVSVAAVGLTIMMAANAPPIEGPRLGDLTVSAATYGLPIVKGWGVVRLGGNMIWSPGIKEHKEQHGGKGSLMGGKQRTVTYTYTASVAFAFAAGPADKILRIWADSKLVYDESGASLGVQGVAIRQYLGTEEQMPDPAIVADKGVGNVPGFRGLVYVVAENIPLAPFGNRIPNISAEIAFSGLTTATVHPQVNTIPVESNPFGGSYALQSTTQTYDFGRNFSYREVNWFYNPPGGIEVTDMSGMTATRVVTVDDIYEGTAFTRPSGGVIAELTAGPGTDLYAAIGNTSTNYCHFVRISPETLKVTGDFFAGAGASGFPPTTVATAVTRTSGTETPKSVVNKNYITTSGFRAIVAYITMNRGPVLWDGSQMLDPYIWGAQSAIASPQPRLDSYVYLDHILAGAINTDGSCDFWFVNYGQALLDGTPVDPAIDFYKINFGTVVTTSNFHTIAATDILPGTTTVVVQRAEYDRANSAIIMWVGTTYNVPGQTVSIDVTSGAIRWSYTNHYGNWHVNSDQSILEGNTITFSDGAGVIFTTLNTSSGEVISQVVGAGTSNSSFNSAYNSRTMTVYQDNLFSATDFVSVVIRGQAKDAILGDIVHDICVEAGLTDAQIDTSELTDDVHGYSHVQEVSRTLLVDLAGVYFFDGTESDYKIKFKKRGSAPIFTVPYANVLPVGTQNAALPVQRNQAEDLPRRVWIRYPDINNDQQQGTQYWARSQAPNTVAVINSAGEMTLDLRLVLNADEAKTMAKKRLLMLWQERETFPTIGLPPSYMTLDPADVINVTLRDGDIARVRIYKVALGADMSLQASGTLEDESLLLLTATGDGGSGITPTLIPTYYTPITTQYEMPLVRDIDDTAGLALREYGAFGAYSGQNFAGASLYNSVDGYSYEALMSSTNSMIWGTALNALPAPPISPFITDVTNYLDVAMVYGGLTLETATTSQVLEGANAAILATPTGEVEVIQYTTVTPYGGGIYRLTGLVRGRRGSEWVCGLHTSADRFVVLETGAWQESRVPLSWLNVTRYEKTVGMLDVFDAVPAQTRIYQGTAEKPYAPVWITGSRDMSGDMTIAWIRRTRMGGEWYDGVEVVPLHEDTESYSIDIMSGTTVLSTLTSTTPSVVYTAAQQTTDGTSGGPVSVNVYQLSAAVGRGFPGAATVG